MCYKLIYIILFIYPGIKIEVLKRCRSTEMNDRALKGRLGTSTLKTSSSNFLEVEIGYDEHSGL